MFTDLYPCHTVKDNQLYVKGRLGVATSVSVLKQNIARMTKNPDDYFLRQDLGTIIENPSLTGRCYDLGYLPDCGEIALEVTIRGSASAAQKEERARVSLAYKILARNATHGASYQVETRGDSVTLRAIPVVLTRSM